MEMGPIADATPLVVDLDGTLSRGDVLWEDLLAHLGTDPAGTAACCRALIRGKAQLKHHAASRSAFDPGALPYNTSVIDLIDRARQSGRRVYLATGAHASRASAVAAHLGLFDGVFATSETDNMAGRRKAEMLADAFGEGGFDYVGNGWSDIPVWLASRRAHVVAPEGALSRRLTRMGIAFDRLADRGSSRFEDWTRAMRVHQYAKNLLVFVPLMTAQRFDLATILANLLAFVAFSLIASSVYLLNDLIDIAADRGHPSKRQRPIASSLIQPPSAIVASFLLLVAGATVAATVSLPLLGVVAGYFAMTLAYSTFLKRKMFVDIIVLSLLYTIRIEGGAVAAGVVLSSWLAIFSLFFFTSLALIKRYTELRVRLVNELADPSNRDYRKDDLTVIGALAAACGMNSVTVFALYVASPTVAANYARPWLLWAICPLLLYLLGRMLIMAHRGSMDDDPIVFALRDRSWRMASALLAAIFVGAIL